MRKLIPIIILLSAAVVITNVGINRNQTLRSEATDLILMESFQIPHPYIGGEYDPKTGEILSPKITLLHISTRDRKSSFFVRAAITEHDALMMIRTREPSELQVRFDREP